MLDSPGACIPQSQTARIIEFFLMPDEICIPMTPTSIRMGSVASLPGVPQIAHAHGRPGAINLPGRRAVLVVVCFQQSRQRLQATKPSEHCPPPSPQTSHHICKRIHHICKAHAGKGCSQGSRHLLPPTTKWVSPCSLAGRGWLYQGFCTAESNGSFGIL